MADQLTSALALFLDTTLLKTNPNYISDLEKTALSKNITIQEWNAFVYQLQDIIKKDTETYEGFEKVLEDLEAISIRIATIEPYVDRIENLENTAGTLSDTVAEHTQHITALNTEVSEHDASISSLTTDLQEYMETSNTDFKTLYHNVESLESTVAQHRNQISDIVNDVEEFKDYSHNAFANALKGTASGEIVALDDVSPLAHKVGVKLRSKNLFDVSKVPSLEQAHGTIGTNNGDGSITIKGYAYNTGVLLKDLAPALKVGDTAILSATYDNEPSYKAILMQEANFGWNFGKAIEVTEAMLNSRVNLYGSKNYTVDDETTIITLSNIQIELGTTATAYVPYVVDDTEITVKSCGKNLFDGVLLNTTTGLAYRRIEMYFVAGVYTISFSNQVYWQSSNTGYNGKQINHWFTFTIADSGIYWMQFRMAESNSTPWDESTLIQVERGTVVTAYEPYFEYEVTRTLQDGVELLSVAPNMTIRAKNAGVVIEVNYNKDSNIVIEKLTQAIISLGGNI